jgi:hypothetical protein
VNGIKWILMIFHIFPIWGFVGMNGMVKREFHFILLNVP